MRTINLLLRVNPDADPEPAGALVTIVVPTVAVLPLDRAGVADLLDDCAQAAALYRQDPRTIAIRKRDERVDYSDDAQLRDRVGAAGWEVVPPSDLAVVDFGVRTVGNQRVIFAHSTTQTQAVAWIGQVIDSELPFTTTALDRSALEELAARMDRAAADYSVCVATRDGQHRPQAGPIDPQLPVTHFSVECGECGLTTGHEMPDAREIAWG